MCDCAPEWLTYKQLAEALSVHWKTVAEWAADPDSGLIVKRLGPSGRLVRIHRSVLDRDSTPRTA